MNDVFGSTKRESTQKKGYTLPQPIMFNTDITRIINSDEIQSIVRPANKVLSRAQRKKNPLKNFGARVKLNPYALAARRAELLAQEARAATKAATLKKARAAKKAHAARKKANYQQLVNDELF